MFYSLKLNESTQAVEKAEMERSKCERDLKDSNNELRHLEKLLAGKNKKKLELIKKT